VPRIFGTSALAYHYRIHRNRAKQEFMGIAVGIMFRPEFYAKAATFRTVPNLTRTDGLTTAVTGWMYILLGQFRI
jgi:hypothetical protein